MQQRTVQKKQIMLEENDRVERAEMELRKKQADNDFQLGLGLMTLLVFFSAATDAYGLISNIAENTLSGGWLIAFWISFALCVIVFAYTANSVIKAMKKNGLLKKINRKE